MKPEEIESARKALADIGRIVAERDSLRRAVKEMRESENEMARKHAAEVDARIAEIKDLEAELASRPVVESEAARKVRAKCEAAVRSGWEAIPELAEWLAEAPRTETPEDRHLREALTRWLNSYAQDIEADLPMDPVAVALQPAASAWLAARKAAQPDNAKLMRAATGNPAPQSWLTDSDDPFEPVSRLTPLEQAAVELAEAFWVRRAADYPTVGVENDAYDVARERYLALRDGEHVTEKEKPAPHQPETVDVWLAQYADGQIYSMPEGLHGVASHQTAARFIRVRLPVVEVVDNEKGGV